MATIKAIFASACKVEHGGGRMFDLETQKRFWGYVEKSPDPEGCWSWRGSKLRGYGQFYANGQKYRSHRVSWMFEHGKIPRGRDVHHRCENKSCVNPAHLRAISHGANMKEAARRGVWAGERNGRARRTESQVRIIRCLNAVGLSAERISRSVQIPLRSVYYCLGEGWRHLKF